MEPSLHEVGAARPAEQKGAAMVRRLIRSPRYSGAAARFFLSAPAASRMMVRKTANVSIRAIDPGHRPQLTDT